MEVRSGENLFNYTYHLSEAERRFRVNPGKLRSVLVNSERRSRESVGRAPDR